MNPYAKPVKKAQERQANYLPKKQVRRLLRKRGQTQRRQHRRTTVTTTAKRCQCMMNLFLAG